MEAALVITIFIFTLSLILCIWILGLVYNLGRKVDHLGQRIESLRSQQRVEKQIPEAAAEVPVPAIEPEAIPAEPELPVEIPEEEPTPFAKSQGPPPLPERLEPFIRISKTETPSASETEPKAPAVEEAAAREPGKFESAARTVLSKIWNWIVVGEEHRPEGVSMEYAVASNWLLRIGVLVLVVGIGFFLKYSIAQGWLGPVARVGLSTLAGLAMMVGGLRLFGGRYALLGQGLAGAGFATLYFSFYIAQYLGVLNSMPAFGIMALTTIAAGVIAIRFNSLLVAVLGLLGGYGTPLMIGGDPSEVVTLFGYLLLLGSGVLFIAWKKDWRLLHYLSFAANWFLVLRTADTQFNSNRFWEFMPFAIGFFLLFSTIAFIFHLVNRRKSTVLELIFLFLNATVFLAFSIHFVQATYRKEVLAIVTLSLAVFYIGHIYLFLYRRIKDRGLLLTFIGLASFFVAITLPLVLSKGWITVSWAVQAFIMLWIASRLRSEFLRQLAYLLYAVVFFRFLAFDFHGQFESSLSGLSTTQFWQQLLERLIVFGIPVASLAAAARLFRTSFSQPGSLAVSEDNDVKGWIGSGLITKIFFWTVIGLTFLYLNREIIYSIGYFYEPLKLPALTLVWVALCFVLLAHVLPQSAGAAVKVFLWIFVVLTMAKLVFFDGFRLMSSRTLAFRETSLFDGYGLRLIDYGSVIALLLLGWILLGKRRDERTASLTFGYCALALGFLYTSQEVWTTLIKFLPEFTQGGLSLFWSFFAFGLLFTGIVKQVRPLRWIGLSMIAGVVTKVVFVDLADLDQVYRIIAFIVLGIVVLVCSFLYLRFRPSFETNENNSSSSRENED